MSGQYNQNKNMKQRKALIIILKSRGVEQFTLPIVQENSHGFICRTGQGDSPATEWFAKDGKFVTTKEIK